MFKINFCYLPGYFVSLVFFTLQIHVLDNFFFDALFAGRMDYMILYSSLTDQWVCHCVGI